MLLQAREGEDSPKMQYAWGQGSRALSSSAGSASVCARNPTKGMCTSDHATSTMPPCCLPSRLMLSGGIFSSCMSHERNTHVKVLLGKCFGMRLETRAAELSELSVRQRCQARIVPPIDKDRMDSIRRHERNHRAKDPYPHIYT